MSKPTVPFWQPGDSWKPPIVRIKGVDTKSLEGQALLRQFEGPIKQFYLGASRAHAAGEVDQSRMTRQFPAATMQYRNLFGQEIIDVEVRPEIVEKVSKRPPVRKPRPNWALVSFTAPYSASTYAIGMLARPPGDTGNARATYSRGGWPWFAWGNPIIDPFKQQAFGSDASDYPVAVAGSFSDTTYEISLLIDLRKYKDPSQGVVTLDIYGALVTWASEQVGWKTTWNRTENHISDPGDASLQDFPLGNWSTLSADWASRGFNPVYMQAFDGTDGTEIGKMELGFGYISVQDSVLFADMPEPGPTITSGSVSDPYEHYRNVSVVRDMTTGLVTQFFFAGIQKNSADGTATTRWGPTRNYYDVVPLTDTVQRLSQGPGEVRATYIWGSPTWQVEQQNIPSTVGYMYNQFRWHTADKPVAEMNLKRLGAFDWGPSGNPITSATTTLNLGSESTKLGTLNLLLDEPSIAFGAKLR